MLKIAMVSDSSCDIDPKKAKEWGIYILPNYIIFDKEIYKDEVDFTLDEFLNKFEDFEGIIKTSKITSNSCKEMYQKLLNEGFEYIISIHTSSKVSENIDSARTAVEEMGVDNIHVIDSLSASIGIASLLYFTKILISQGESYENIIHKVYEKTKTVFCGFYVGDIDYLVRSGRIGKARAMIGNLLGLKPMIYGKDGILVPWVKVQSEKAVFETLLNSCLDDGKDSPFIIIAHSHSQFTQGEKLFAELLSSGAKKEIILFEHRGSVTANFGTDMLTISYLR